ncbi:protein PET117, mitochondrial [Bombus impatiens]|uniref:Protein PET117, mitochondrial n=1 Tax=Bombus impatiens TaxID=132113 RepID=A0A6P8LWD9_BOMIM|nr:protein PET117, mitochondrial [Bombus impatiens]XP_033178844.1 protein PET117, mitochondrial [Bombus impatiens]XP_033178874.1 protein PET117, mitochondrial [Bombus impatiens]
MSLAAKTTFVLCCATTAWMVGYVHYQQEAERRQLRLGVERDIERQERRKLRKAQQETQSVEPLLEAAKQGPILQTT